MAAHATVHTYELSIPILVGVWLDRFETLELVVATFPVTPAVVGVVVGVGYALFGLGALPGGILADAVGSKPLVVACSVGMGGAFLLVGAAPGLAVVGLALAAWGVAASVYHPAGLALISKAVSDPGAGFAYHGMAGNLGIAGGPLVTTLLLVAVDWRTAAVLLAVPAVVCGAFAAWIDVDETAAVGASTGRQPRGIGSVASLAEFRSETRALFAGTFVVVFGVVVASGLFYRGVLTFLPEILAEYDWLPGLAVGDRRLPPSRLAYVGLLAVGMAGQFAGGKATDRIDPPTGIAASFAALAVLAVAFLPLSTAGIAGFVLGGAGLGFVLFLVQPMYQALIAEITPSDTRGLSYGYTYLGVFGVGAAGGVLAGWLLTVGSPPALFLVLAGVAVVAAGLGAWIAHASTREA